MNKARTDIRLLVVTALLAAIGIAIPMYSPAKIIIGPASFTLASHVPVFFAMFVSPSVAVAVALISAVGFLFGGFPLVIVVRALTHVIFAALGGFFLKKFPAVFEKNGLRILFSAVIGLIHGVSEVVAVLPFYYGGKLSQSSYTSGFFVTVLLLVGVGSFVHSMVDFEIATWLFKATKPAFSLSSRAAKPNDL